MVRMGCLVEREEEEGGVVVEKVVKFDGKNGLFGGKRGRRR